MLTEFQIGKAVQNQIFEDRIGSEGVVVSRNSLFEETGSPLPAPTLPWLRSGPQRHPHNRPTHISALGTERFVYGLATHNGTVEVRLDGRTKFDGHGRNNRSAHLRVVIIYEIFETTGIRMVLLDTAFAFRFTQQEVIQQKCVRDGDRPCHLQHQCRAARTQLKILVLPCNP